MSVSLSRAEKLLDGFEPTFEFEPVVPLPAEEFTERLRIVRREAAVREYDALLVHAEPVGWYHTSNPLLRYLCDWIREGLLIIPTDSDREATLLTFFGSEVLFPPPGEPTWVDDIRQVGLWGREQWARPGDPVAKVVAAAEDVLTRELGLANGRFGVLGDASSQSYWEALLEVMPGAGFSEATDIVARMQKIRSPREQALVRAAAQLIDIGVQAAQHVIRPGVSDHEIYAAFTYAQLARGGETGDGYQIGINPFGTHISKPYGRRVEEGDVVQLYLSQVTYRGYDAQAARMVIVGQASAELESLVDASVEGVTRAIAAAGPGVPVSTVNEAGFGPYIERGYLGFCDGRTMPFAYAPEESGTARRFRVEAVAEPGWNGLGRDLRHVYPATPGPIAPRIGHSVSMAGLGGYAVISTNEDVLVPGMTLVVHTQWFEPGRMGCNIGSCLLITEDGVENLNAHTDFAPHRVGV
jgi:Xaa-Pro aminopeptidase